MKVTIMNKVKIVILLGVVITSSMLFILDRFDPFARDNLANLSNQDLTVQPKEISDSNQSNHIAAPLSVPTPAPKPVEIVVVDEQKLKADQDELSILIDQYNQHLSDPVKRKEIEQQAALIATSYKQQVLNKVKSLR